MNGTDGGDWATHRIEHAVSALYDIPHGGGLAILFPELAGACAGGRSIPGETACGESVWN